MNVIDPAGRSAVVTGSTAGIGFAIAKGLAEAGAAVLINCRTRRKGDQARERLLECVPRASIQAGVVRTIA